MNQIHSDIARPTGRTTTSNEMLSYTPLETHVPSEEFSVTEIDYNSTFDNVSRSGESQALRTPCLSQSSIRAKGVASNKSTVSDGTSQSGRVRTMSQRMADSKSQRDFYGTTGMHYVDDGIFLGNNDAQLQQAIKEIQDLGLNIEDQGHPSDYVGVSIKKLHNGSYEFTQRALINAIINDVGINDSRTKPVPAKVSLRLHAFKGEPTFDLNFNYRSVGGKLNCLAQTTRPDIMYAVHQIPKYSSDPRKSHGKAILYLVCYLKKTRELGICFKPDPKKGFKC
jgi:hypothetical protein